MPEFDSELEKAIRKYRVAYLKERGDGKPVCPYLDNCLLANDGVSALETFCMNFQKCSEKRRRDRFRVN